MIITFLPCCHFHFTPVSFAWLLSVHVHISCVRPAIQKRASVCSVSVLKPLLQLRLTELVTQLSIHRHLLYRSVDCTLPLARWCLKVLVFFLSHLTSLSSGLSGFKIISFRVLRTLFHCFLISFIGTDEPCVFSFDSLHCHPFALGYFMCMCALSVWMPEYFLCASYPGSEDGIFSPGTRV